jgi:NAD(P)-dependent dehydrogenase (short-subunit alcohol dehydrogenase family)
MLQRVVDGMMEATIVPSFSKAGPWVRSRLYDWDHIDVDLAGRTVLITGATSGIGLAAAVGLAERGARIVAVGRDEERGEKAVAEIRSRATSTAVEFAPLDMGDLTAVRAFGERFVAAESRLDALVHNAGALLPERRETDDGVEVTLAVHLLGPYVLTRALHPLLAATPQSRVIFMSSGGMYAFGLDLRRLELSPRGYDGRAAYARAKRAQVVLAELLAEEFAGDGIVVHSMHPGWADTAGVEAGIPGFRKVTRPILRSAEEGADTLVWLVASDEALRSTAGFWHDRRRRSTVKFPGTSVDADARAGLIPSIEARIERALAS